jgi:hypothetical protein
MKNQPVIIADHPAKGEVNHCSIHRGGLFGAKVLPGFLPHPLKPYLLSPCIERRVSGPASAKRLRSTQHDKHPVISRIWYHQYVA